MRLHTTTVLSLSALAVLALAGCSHGSAVSSGPMSSPTVPVHPDDESVQASAPRSSVALAKRLLDETDLGGDYAHMARRPAAHDDMTVIGPPFGAPLPWQGAPMHAEPASTTDVRLRTALSLAEARPRLPRSTSAGRLSVRTGSLW